MASRDPEAPADAVQRSAHRGLDWLNLYVANIQTGFGPFIAVYLTSRSWTQADIGFALSIGTLTTMASQIPAGAVVDAFRSKVLVAGLSMAAFAIAALMFALWPIPLSVYLAEVLHGFSSATLTPAVAAISLILVGTTGMSWRLSRNSRYSALGNGVGAALLGAIGSLVSERAVFLLTAVLTIPAFFALRPLRRSRIGSGGVAPAAEDRAAPRPAAATWWPVIRDGRLLLLCLCAFAFTFANAPMLPLAAAELTDHLGHLASILIGVAIVVPQVIVLLASPLVGRLADRHGRKPVLLVGCAMLPLHGIALALSASPYVVIGSELVDGVAAVCFGIMMPLITSDVAGDSGHYNLALGFVGFAMGIGASLATPVAGEIVDHFSYTTAFGLLAVAGVVATLIAAARTETRLVAPVT
ncbi:MAG TPA: MFS transporter [Nevskiaceae bacterium]